MFVKNDLYRGVGEHTRSLCIHRQEETLLHGDIFWADLELFRRPGKKAQILQTARCGRLWHVRAILNFSGNRYFLFEQFLGEGCPGVS
jgi:hypothetical protein